MHSFPSSPKKEKIKNKTETPSNNDRGGAEGWAGGGALFTFGGRGAPNLWDKKIHIIIELSIVRNWSIHVI